MGIGTFVTGLFGKAGTGTAIKDTLTGAREVTGGLAKDIREAITGEGTQVKFKEIELEVAKLDTELAKAQAEVTKAEAQGNPFQRSWRPGLAWVIILVIAFQYLVYPMASWISAWASWAEIPAPAFKAADLWPIILGLIGYRTIEKTQQMRQQES